jgi:hypothetical protein
MNNNRYPDNCQSITDKSLPWNVKECDECGTEDFKNSDCDTCRYMHGLDPHDNEAPDYE